MLMQSWLIPYLLYDKAFYLDCAQIIFIVQKMINVMVMQWYSLNMQQEVLIIHA
jgi:hypothetical protein